MIFKIFTLAFLFAAGPALGQMDAHQYQRQQQFLQQQENNRQMREQMHAGPKPTASVAGTINTIKSSAVEDDEIVGVCQLKNGCSGGTASLFDAKDALVQSVKIDNKKKFHFKNVSSQLDYRIHIENVEKTDSAEVRGVRSGRTVFVPDSQAP